MARDVGPLTEWQKEAAKNYGGGDFAHYEDIGKIRADQDEGLLGDNLFYALMIDLDPGEDCDSWDEAVRRMETTLRDVETVQKALEYAVAQKEKVDAASEG